MKIAVLADIHGNWHALQAVMDDVARWQPDDVVVAGDIVNRGPQSVICWEQVAQKVQTDNWKWVRGNHEDYMVALADPAFTHSEAAREVHRAAHWTRRELGSALAALPNLPFAQTLSAPDGAILRVVHASVQHNRRGIYPDTPSPQLSPLLSSTTYPRPSVLVVAHTHRSFIRECEGSLILNCGAVGAPFDGYRTASYARLTWSREHGWQGEIVRLPYDRAAARKAYHQSGYLAAGGPLAHIMYLEFEHASPLLSEWTSRYEKAVLAGAITVADSVDAYLASL